MASETQIAKLALQHVGDRFDIGSLSEASTEAEAINLVYEDALRAALRQHVWKFAKKYVSPAYISGVTPPAEWDYMFSYPNDAVKVFRVVNPLGRTLTPIEFDSCLFDVTGTGNDVRVLLCNEEDPEFEYVKYETNAELYDPLFVQCFSLMLASMVATSLTGDTQLAQGLFQRALYMTSVAESEDSNEGPVAEQPDAPWIQARS